MSETNEKQTNNDDSATKNGSGRGGEQEVIDAIAKAAVERTDQNQVYSLRVKSEYVGDQRPTCLGPIPEQYKISQEDDGDRDTGEDKKDDRDGGGGRNNRRNKKKN